MSDRSSYAVTLELTGIDDLFRAPELSPLDPRYADHSSEPALEFIAAEIRGRRSCRSAAATFVVPQQTQPSTSDVRDATARWASARIRGCRHDIDATRTRGLHSLAAGVVLFAVLIGLGQVIGDGGDDLASTVSKGLEVAAWVALWFPIDTLLFSLWQHRLDRRSYEIVADMDIAITSPT